MQLYDKKLDNVDKNVMSLRQEVKDLYHKKKQIENLKEQKRLQAQLETAQADLKTLQDAVTHAQSETEQFNAKKKDVVSVISTLQSALNAVRFKLFRFLR